MKREDVLAFDAALRDPVLLVLPTLVLDAAADRVEEVERAVRADKMEACEGEVLSRSDLPVIEGPATEGELPLSVSARDVKGKSTWLGRGLSWIVANRVDSTPRLEIDRLRPALESVFKEADDVVEANEAIEFRFVDGIKLRDNDAGGSW